MKLKNDMTLDIRKATKEDAYRMIKYLNSIGGESDNLLFGKGEFHRTVEEEEKFIEDLSATPTSALFLGIIEGEIVCIGSMIGPQRERIAHHVDLGITVRRKYWGLGVGTQLMQEMINFAKSNGKTEIIHLGVREDNVVAIGLYKKMGFEEIGRYKKYFKINGVYWDEILMNLYL